MTDSKNKRKYDSLLLLIPTVLALILLLSFPDTVGDGVRHGMQLCYRAVIPSVFPFMVLSELLSGCDLSFLDRTVGAVFSRLFRVGRRGARAIILGIICGFPLGVKSVCEEYAAGALTKNEAERLLCFANNTGPGFLVAGIGISMRGSPRDGMILLLVQLLLSLSTGLVLAHARHPDRYMPESAAATHDPAPPSLTEAIRRSAVGTLYVTAFITFFSVISALIRHLVKNGVLALIAACFLEIGSAAALSATMKTAFPRLSLSLAAFAVCFSGISVHCQSLVYIRKTDLSARMYFKAKLISGALAFLITWMISG